MLNRYWMLSLLAVLLSTAMPDKVVADDAVPGAVPGAEAEEGGEAEPNTQEVDPFAIPENASADELLKFIEQVSTLRQPARTREEFIVNITKAQEAVSQAATLVLEMKDVTDEQAVVAVQARINALRLLSRIGSDKAAEQLETFTDSLKNDPRPAIAEMMKLQLLASAIAGLPNASEEERNKFVADLKAYLGGRKVVTRDDLMLAMSAGQALEHVEANIAAAELYQEIGKLAANSEDEQMKSFAKRFDGMARRIGLLGNKMEVFGPTLDGEELKWEDYRGKVVLIDFWATWCGPCIAELPNLKENYDTYHSRGFDVIGISLDNEKEKLEEFIKKREIAWPTIYDADSNGWDNPLAQHYGISGIPTAILVDKEGKVVSLNARGEALGEMLAELIGPANETVEEDPAGAENVEEEATEKPAK